MKNISDFMEKMIINNNFTPETITGNFWHGLNRVDNEMFQAVLPFLPTLSNEEICSRSVSSILDPLKKVDSNNIFGSKWNEITTIAAATRIGFPNKKLHKVITSPANVGSRLRDAQKNLADETENSLKRLIRTSKIFPELEKKLRLDTWESLLTNEARNEFAKGKSDLTKSEKVKITNNSITSLKEIIEFSKGQKINDLDIFRELIRAQTMKPINIVNLHCMSFVNDPIKGITVSTTAENFNVSDSTGNKLVVSQMDPISKVREFTDIFRKNSIPFRLTFLVFDNDKIVLDGQDENIKHFMKSFKCVLHRNIPDAEIVLSSQIINADEFEEKWKSFNLTRPKLIESIVNDEFERLQTKTLPENQKSRTFARSVAHKMFKLQIATGFVLPQIFNPLFIMQRTKAPQQSSELFKIGTNLANAKTPVLIGHWNDRKTV